MPHTIVTDLPRQLGDGLVLRQARPEDAQAVGDFNAAVHGGPGGPPAEQIAWVLDVFERRLPGLGPEHFLIVEDTRAGCIASVTNLMQLTWSIGGIPFGVGRPESVGTLPEYRRRGLVRAQFAVLHAWSEARGDLVQAITGIAYFYRQFGYEMAMILEGGRMGRPIDLLPSNPLPQPLSPEGRGEQESPSPSEGEGRGGGDAAVDAPTLSPSPSPWKGEGSESPAPSEGEGRGGGEPAPFRLRPVAEADVPFIMQVDAAAGRRNIVANVNDEAHWRYELLGKRVLNGSRLEYRVLETPAGERAGYIGYLPHLIPQIVMPVCELADGFSWLAAAPVILRHLLAEGERLAVSDGKPCAGVYAELGTEHPFLEVTHRRLPEVRRPYAWYVRVPDLLRFLQHIAPALEARLAGSAAAHYSGRLRISLYRRGIELELADGRLAGIGPWQPDRPEDGDLLVPELTFLQLLFGWRDFDELYAQYPDCYAQNDEARAVTRAMFPKGPSPMWPVS